MKLPRAALLAALAAVALPSVASAATTQPVPVAGPAPSIVSVEPNETPVDGWGGWLIWSRRGPDGQYALIARNPQGEGIALPVAPQAIPIDASIGPGPDGAPLVVYSRCASTTSTPPQGCDVFRIDPVTGAGGPVAAASRPDRDERYPSVWDDRIAFSLTSPGRTTRAGVAVASLAGAPPKAATYFGPRTERVAGRTVRDVDYGPHGIDLRGGRVAFSWRTKGPSAGERSRLVQAGKRGTERTLLTAPTTAQTISEIGRPALSRSHVVVPVLRTGGQGRSEVVQTTLSGKQRWTLQGGFSAAQTERYGSAFTAVARTTASDLVVVRRLASDGQWGCTNQALPDARGCEILRYADPTPNWVRVSTKG